jgi:hypothetical protein
MKTQDEDSLKNFTNPENSRKPRNQCLPRRPGVGFKSLSRDSFSVFFSLLKMAKQKTTKEQ